MMSIKKWNGYDFLHNKLLSQSAEVSGRNGSTIYYVFDKSVKFLDVEGAFFDTVSYIREY